MPASLTTSGTYDKVSLAYEEQIIPYYRDIAKTLVSVARPQKGDRILDVGAGTGIVARVAEASLRPNGMVALLDRAAPMLAIARQRMSEIRGAAAWVCLVDQSESMSLDSDQFDAVLGQFSYVEESPKAMREVLRVLRPGGKLALAVWGPDRLHEEYYLIKAARKILGASPQPRHQSIATIVKDLRSAGFVAAKSRQQFFRGVYADLDSFIAYRDAFPWHTLLDRGFWADYLPAVRAAASAYQDRRGRVILRRSVSFITARRPS
ncbi:MAG TPA: methyltransferase domain-containing protein [Candidatus Dormibacteraeota bacterium]|nr:methyltransferase domain-containing protein [Candidatus Dormibacteraeota bacterium]